MTKRRMAVATMPTVCGHAISMLSDRGEAYDAEHVRLEQSGG